MDKSGVIYILTNPSFPEYVKIGYRYLRINLIGEICNGSFSFGVTKMPPVFSEIMIISEADLRLMLDINSGEIVDENGKTKLTVLPIGTSVIFPEYQVKVKLPLFLAIKMRTSIMIEESTPHPILFQYQRQ